MRQRQVIAGLANGRTCEEIAGDLGLSPKTVEYHRAEAYAALNVWDIASLTKCALALGLADLTIGTDAPAPDPLSVRLFEVLRETAAAGDPFRWDAPIPIRFRPLLALAIVDEFETDSPPEDLETFEALRQWLHAEFNQ